MDKHSKRHRLILVVNAFLLADLNTLGNGCIFLLVMSLRENFLYLELNLRQIHLREHHQVLQ